MDILETTTVHTLEKKTDLILTTTTDHILTTTNAHTHLIVKRPHRVVLMIENTKKQELPERDKILSITVLIQKNIIGKTIVLRSSTRTNKIKRKR